MADDTLSEYLPRPTVVFAAQRIAELKRLDLRRAELPFLWGRLKPLVSGLVFMSADAIQGGLLYRGRLMNEMPTNVSEVGPVPAGLNTRYGRVNRPGEPVFYLSESMGSVVREIRGQPGQTLAIAYYKTKRKLLTVPAGFHVDVMKAKGWIRELPHWCYETKGPLSRQLNRLITRFLAEQFLKNVLDNEDHLYKLSVAWARGFMGPNGMDGVTYPSVANNGVSYNIAIQSSRVSEALELVQIDFLRIKSVVSDGVNFTLLAEATQFDVDGKITFSTENISKEE